MQAFIKTCWQAGRRVPSSSRLRGAATAVGAGVAVWMIVAAAAGQLPNSMDAFIAEPLHTVRGRVAHEHFGDPDTHLGVELTMPTSVDAGSFTAERMNFSLFSVSGVQIVWARGYGVDDLLGPATDSTVRGDGFVARETAGTVTRGDGWAARIYTSEYSLGADTSVRGHARVVTRIDSPRDLVCVGGADVEPVASTGRVRDWLLERCRSVRIVAVP